MKPAFALSFSENGISLHHWSDGDWYCIGTVALTETDLAADMQALRDQGFALKHDLSCRLIIPPDQVRILTVDVAELTPEAREQAIRDILAGATPYDLDDLAYTLSADDQATQVAAVAKSTLIEASEFARTYGFVPERFCLCATELGALTDPQFELTAEMTPFVAEPSDEPQDAVKDDADQDAPLVHQIAQAADPEAFRSVQSESTPTRVFSGKRGRLLVPVVAASVLFGMVLGVWSLRPSQPQDSGVPAERTNATVTPPQPRVEVADAPTLPEAPSANQTNTVPQSEPPAPEVAALPAKPQEPTAEDSPPLSPTDEAILEALTSDPILEALNVAPKPVELISPDVSNDPVFRDFTGTVPRAPAALSPPAVRGLGDIYLSSVDRSDLSQDAVALPGFDSLTTDAPVEVVALPGQAGQRFELDERGLVSPSRDGTLNPDGIMVYLGRPSSVPPEPPVRFEADPTEAESEADTRLAGFRPRPRPANLVDQFERDQLGGRSREELAVIRPKLRPEGLEVPPEVDHTPTALAVVRVPRPKPRSPNIAALVAQKPGDAKAPLGSTANVTAKSDEAGSFQPKTVKPKIPTTASVARQATIDNAINLRKLNLIGVYGTTANRRALVRLPSGRYRKLKIGDRIDGGNVIAIGDSELRYQKGGRNVTLKIPSG